jgi:hypothetical protein
MNLDCLQLTQNWLLAIQAFIMLGSAIIIICGWRYTSRKEIDNAITLKRMDFRGEAFRSFLPIISDLQTNGGRDIENKKVFMENLKKSSNLFELYCYQDEIDTHRQFIASLKAGDHMETEKAYNKLVQMIRVHTRHDLKIPESTHKQ